MSNLKGTMYLSIHSATDSSRVLEIQKLNKAIERRNHALKKLTEKYSHLKHNFETEVGYEVEERLSEMNAESEAWDREASNLLMQLCDEWGLDHLDYPEGVTIQDAYDYLSECFRVYKDLKFRMDGLEK